MCFFAEFKNVLVSLSVSSVRSKREKGEGTLFHVS